ncbi:MAG: 16S rRNA (guanine(527)-N(7))-methyltransferase RsmG, partial [Bacteroidales bacterium]|nr:16S rRNA (guanine(527)-N(7))-methyltransferase RsmG [Bacteroidales bacterium]
KYFPDISGTQQRQFESLYKLYHDWNSKVNVISRKDIDHLYERHVLHSLSIAKVVRFKAYTEIMDAGTGGGFPGIPLAIMFPEAKFYLVDSIGKKIKVVKEISKALGLKNLKAEQIRVENVKQSFDFIVSRAVTNLPGFIRLSGYKFHKKSFNEISNGILYLKGGDFDDELQNLNKKHRVYNIEDFFDEEFFQTKKIVHIF